MISNKNADKITNVSKTSVLKILGTVRNETENIEGDKEIIK